MIAPSQTKNDGHPDKNPKLSSNDGIDSGATANFMKTELKKKKQSIRSCSALSLKEATRWKRPARGTLEGLKA
jgi:hypothetical protein